MDDKELRANIELWVGDFERAIADGDAEALRALFSETAYFRDNGAMTWDFRQFHDKNSLINALLAVGPIIKPHAFRISPNWPEPKVQGEGGSGIVEAFVDFETAEGAAVAVLNGSMSSTSRYGFDMFALYTRLEGIKSAKQPEVYPRGNGYMPNHSGETWLENHTRACEHVDSEPEVLIVGAGQAGLMVAAHLKKLGVKALIVDRNERVGDNWYKRYASLHLHNPLEMNEFPYLEFPEHFPEYLPKDLVGQWLEIYAQYLDLNVWTSTEFQGASYDDQAKRWAASVVRADGSTRELRPQHVILATGGIGGKPSVPALPGLDTFNGEVIHSSKYTKASDFNAKKVLIVGAATSAHDIADDLYSNGVEATMLQRGPVVVSNIDTANLAYAGYINPDIPTDLVDIRYGIGLINPLREKISKQYHQMATSRDAELLEGLSKAGLRLGDGFNGQGWLDLFLRTGGGYYLNKGTSEIIADGGIKVEQYSRVVKFVANGAQLDDGSVIEADLVVLATGYQNRRVEVAEWFGEEVAERVGEIATLDDEGEWANIWGQTGQRGLWLNGGGINQARPGSKRLALLIKADIEGLIPDDFRRPAKNSTKQAFYKSTDSHTSEASHLAEIIK